MGRHSAAAMAAPVAVPWSTARHSAGRKVRAPGRHHRRNRAAEALLVVGLLLAAVFAGWVSYQPASGPPGSVLNAPVAVAPPSRPTERAVPPVAAADLVSNRSPAKKPKSTHSCS